MQFVYNMVLAPKDNHSDLANCSLSTSGAYIHEITVLKIFHFYMENLFAQF